MPESWRLSNYALDSSYRLAGQSKVIAIHRGGDRRLKSTPVHPWASHTSLPLDFVALHLLCLLFHFHRVPSQAGKASVLLLPSEMAEFQVQEGSNLIRPLAH